jgi:hypothetical protein
MNVSPERCLTSRSGSPSSRDATRPGTSLDDARLDQCLGPARSAGVGPAVVARCCGVERERGRPSRRHLGDEVSDRRRGADLPGVVERQSLRMSQCGSPGRRRPDRRRERPDRPRSAHGRTSCAPCPDRPSPRARLASGTVRTMHRRPPKQPRRSRPGTPWSDRPAAQRTTMVNSPLSCSVQVPSRVPGELNDCCSV